MDRKYLRKKIQDLLKTANIDGVGNDVFSMRSIPSSIEELPIILLYPKNEGVSRFDEAPKRYLRSLNIIIELITVDDSDECLSDTLDDLSAAIEAAIEKDVDLESCVESVELTSVVYDTEGDGQSPVGSAVLNYQIDYITESRDDFTHADFNQADVTWHANDHLDDDTKDIIAINP